MMLGIGEGKIELVLNGSTFYPGQKITGRAQLKIGGPIEARELRVEFYGLIKRNKSYVRIHETREQLDSQRVYRSAEYFDFSLAIPENAIEPNPYSGFFGSLYEIFSHKPRWFVEASLDMPMKFDIRGKTEVKLALRPGGIA